MSSPRAPRLSASSFFLTLFIAVWSGGASASDSAVAECKKLQAAAEADNSEVTDAAAEQEVPLELSVYNVCVDQVSVLLQHAWAPLLARSPQQLTLSDLSGLYQAHQRYTDRKAHTVLPMDGLNAALAQLDQPPPEVLSWWQRLRQWVLEWWREDSEVEFNWLENLSISETAVKAVLYGSLGLILLMVVGIVINEFRAALPRRKNTQARAWLEDGPQAPVELSFEAVAAAPLREQPGLLLLLVLRRLELAGLLKLRDSHTHRDINTAAGAIEQGDLLRFLSRSAERATFGNWQPELDDMEKLREIGKQVCATLPTGPAGKIGVSP